MGDRLFPIPPTKGIQNKYKGLRKVERKKIGQEPWDPAMQLPESPKLKCWNLNPQFLQMWLYLETVIFRDGPGQMRSSGQAVIQYD